MEENKSLFHRDRYTVFLYLMLAIFGFKQAVLGSVLPFLRDELSLTTVEIGWHFSIYALGLVVSSRLVKELSKFASSHLILNCAACAMVAVILLISLSSTITATLVVSILLGLTGGTVQIVIQSLLVDHHGKNQGIALVEAFVMAALGVFLAPLAIGYLAGTDLGWRTALLMPAIFLMFTLFVFRESKAQRHGSFSEFTSSETSTRERLPLYVLLTLGMILLGIATEWGIGFWGAQFIEAQLYKEPDAAVTMMSAFFGGTFVGRIAASRLLRIVSVKSMLVVLMVLGGLSVAVMALSTEASVVWGALFVGGACLGNFFPLILSVANENAPSRSQDISRGATMAVGIALLVVPYVIGKLGALVGLSKVIGLLVIFPVGMVVLFFVSQRMIKKSISV